MGNIAESILDAVDILVDKKVSNLSFNKTVRAKIIEITDSSIGQYKVQYQNSYFTAYSSDSSATYQKGSDVYVEILSNDFEKNALIVGTVQRLGSNYISVIEKLDAYTEVGSPLVYAGTVAYNSYNGGSTYLYKFDESTGNDSTKRLMTDGQTETAGWKNNDHTAILTHTRFKNIVKTAAAAADSIKIGMTIKNNIPIDRRNAGNFGIRIVAQYWDVSKVTRDVETDILTRTYTFDLNQMTGQPYNYVVPTKQYGIFTIDAENLIQINSITTFVENFPKEGTSSGADIWFSDIHIQFLRALTNEELQNSSLKIIAPYGAFLGQDNGNSTPLIAQVKIKGKPVNYKTQKIDFYWFRQNNNIISTSSKYSQYGGIGWELLNTLASTTPYEYNILTDNCPSKNSKIKCVGVYSDNGSVVTLYDIINIVNFNNGVIDYYITSSTGTTFSFNVGKTKLTCLGGSSTSTNIYVWRRSLNGEQSTSVKQGTGANTCDVTINNPSANFVTYICSIFDKNQKLLGTAEIVLTNNKQTLGCTLVINDGTQVFKYDEFGTSPTSEYKAAAQRMTIPALSFDIYDKNGQIIKFIGNKKQYMTIRWFWPIDPENSTISWANSIQKQETMLTTSKTTWQNISIPDVISGGEVRKFALVGEDILSYGILNKYNAAYANSAASRNNIRLEVDYQGEHLVATTNFTFTKEGELGTNGTGYLARIVPKGRVYILGKTGGFYVDGSSKGTSTAISNLFEAQLWNDAIGKITSGVTTQWSISTNSRRTITIPKQGNVNAHAAKTRLTISGNNVTIDTSKSEECYCDIIQACLIYGGRRYYATYPIPYMERDTSSQPILWLDKGYTEVMYQSDGARGTFDGLPFKAMKISGTNLVEIGNTSNTAVTWSSSWGAAARTTPGGLLNQRYIDPPSYYVGDANYKSYIKIVYGASGSQTRAYFPIQFYLNRYGMAAMNEWDGQSIEIKNNEGYILAPQMAAGKKENDNSFTGVAMGQTFQSAEGNQVGLFGYAKGAQSIFLDAETGNAHFGVSGSARINIAADKYGIAPKGSIYSGNYYSEYNDDGSPKTRSSAGMMLDLTTPEIRFGSGNFYVTKDGYIHAGGGGDIAGWKIDNNNLYSSNGKIYLNSSTPKIYGQTNSANKHDSLQNPNAGFYLASNGLSLGSNFRASDAGVLYVGDGATAGTTGKKYWTINGSTSNNVSNSYIRYGTRNTDNSVNIATNEMTLGKNFIVTDTGVMRIGDGAVTGNTNNKYWTIDSTANSNSYISYGTTGNDNKQGVYLGTDSIQLGNKFYAGNDGVVRIGDKAVVGGTGKTYWTINGDSSSSYIRYGSRNTDNSVNIATNEITLGKKFYVDNDGIVRIGNGAVGNTNKHWTIDATGTSDSYIGYNTTTGGTANSVYLGTNKLTLGTKFYVDANGVMEVGKGAGTTTGNHWTIDADNTNSYIKYGDSGATNSVYLGTNKLTLGKKFYVGNNGVVRVGDGAVDPGDNDKYWTINANSDDHRSYISYNNTYAMPEEPIGYNTDISKNNNNKAVPVNSVYLGTDGFRLGQKFAVDNQGNAKFNNLYANGSGQIGGWTIASSSLSSTTKNSLNQDETTTLSSSGTTRLNINNKFKIYPSGAFSAANEYFTVDSDGTLFSNAGKIGGWNIENNSLYSNEKTTNTAEFINTLPTAAQEANLILSTKGAILGPKETLTDYYYFSPNHRVWEIGRNGIAYFSDVKISNRPGSDDENVFEWKTNDNAKTTVFKLEDDNCTIGGFNISGDELTSDSITINSDVEASNTQDPVVNVNNGKLEIKGNGDLNVQNIASGGNASFSGNLNVTGSGTIGGCSFGNGIFKCPAKVLYFDNKAVSLQSLPCVTGITISSATLDFPDEPSDYDVVLSNPQSPCTATFTGTTSTITIGTRSTNYTPEGTIDVNFPSLKVSLSIPESITLKGHFDGMSYEVMTTQEYKDLTPTYYSLGDGVTQDKFS